MSENPLLISLIGGLEIGQTGDVFREPELAGIPLGLLAVLAYESCDGAIVTGDEIGRICWGEERWAAKDMDARRGDFKSALSKVRKAIGDSGRNPEYLVGDFHGLRLDKQRVRTDWQDLRSRENMTLILSEARQADFRFLSNIGLRSVSAKWLEDARESANDAFDDLLDAEAALALDDDNLDAAIESWTQRRMIARRRGFTEYAAEIDAWIAQTKKTRTAGPRKLPTGAQQEAARKFVPERTEWPLAPNGSGKVHDVQTMERIDALDLIASEISVTDRLMIAGSVPPNIVGFLTSNAGYLPEKVTLCLDGSRRSAPRLLGSPTRATAVPRWVQKSWGLGIG